MPPKTIALSTTFLLSITLMVELLTPSVVNMSSTRRWVPFIRSRCIASSLRELPADSNKLDITLLDRSNDCDSSSKAPMILEGILLRWNNSALSACSIASRSLWYRHLFNRSWSHACCSLDIYIYIHVYIFGYPFSLLQQRTYAYLIWYLISLILAFHSSFLFTSLSASASSCDTFFQGNCLLTLGITTVVVCLFTMDER